MGATVPLLPWVLRKKKRVDDYRTVSSVHKASIETVTFTLETFEEAVAHPPQTILLHEVF